MQGIFIQLSSPDVSVVQFRKGEPYLFFKKSHVESTFSKADFLKKAFKELVLQEDSPVISNVSSYKGIVPVRKDGIIRNLVPLMPQNRRRFWLEL